MLVLTVTTKSLNVSVTRTLRGDRQPEFTQVDLETSFLTEQEIQDITEGLIARVMKETKGIEVTLPFPRMKYDDAMALLRF